MTHSEVPSLPVLQNEYVPPRKANIWCVLMPNSWLIILICVLPSRNSPTGPRPPHYLGFMVTPRPTTLGTTPLGRVTQRPIPNNIQHSQVTPIHDPAGFEPKVPTSERPQTQALDHVVPGIGHNFNILVWNPGFLYRTKNNLKLCLCTVRRRMEQRCSSNS
jgi:hypothetical protein